MEYVIKGRKPESVFRFFEEISAIPRPSYHEEKIADHLVKFAKARGLYCYRDELNNVLIKAPATKGWEDRPTLLFQGHTDMVCEKNADVEHDFRRDPLKLWVDGNLLRATGTTLGGDDGIAVAMMMALLDGEIAEHPAYECLFTTAEEVGLNGVHGFDYSLLSARTMINMDSEELGVVTCGCAGGERHDLTLTAKTAPFEGIAMRIGVSGLMGGHSGENIKDGRANANKVMGRLLASLAVECDFRLVSVDGGSKDNAIPRECVAVIATDDYDTAYQHIMGEGAAIAQELVEEDHGFTLTVGKAENAPAEAFTKEDTLRVLCVFSCAANGVLEMSRNVKGLVEYSRNLGVVRTDGNTVLVVFSSRSAMESRLDASARELDVLAAANGFEAKHYSRYPGWDYAPESKAREAYLAAYRDVTGEDACVNVIHAGLECGIIRSNVPDMDVISVGPTMHDIHSPAEALDLDTVEVFWRTVERLIETI